MTHEKKERNITWFMEQDIKRILTWLDTPAARAIPGQVTVHKAGLFISWRLCHHWVFWNVAKGTREKYILN